MATINFNRLVERSFTSNAGGGQYTVTNNEPAGTIAPIYFKLTTGGIETGWSKINAGETVIVNYPNGATITAMAGVGVSATVT